MMMMMMMAMQMQMQVKMERGSHGGCWPSWWTEEWSTLAFGQICDSVAIEGSPAQHILTDRVDGSCKMRCQPHLRVVERKSEIKSV